MSKKYVTLNQIMGVVLRFQRLKQGFGQHDLVTEFNKLEYVEKISHPTYSRIEQGGIRISFLQLFNICACLNIDPSIVYAEYNKLIAGLKKDNYNILSKIVNKDITCIKLKELCDFRRQLLFPHNRILE